MNVQIQSTGYLDSIQQFVQLCISSIWLPFDVKPKAVIKSHAKLASFISLFLPNQQRPDFTLTYSVEVQLFYESCAEQQFILDDLDPYRVTPEQALLFNDLVLCIRRIYRHSIYTKLIEDRKVLTESQKILYKGYVSGLFRSYSKLMVLRVDLGYRANAGTIEQLQTHRDLFFHNRRSNGLFEFMVGYIWMMEFGSERGPHLHLLLFFNGQRVNKDGHYAMGVCSYWNRIVGITAWAHSSNLNKKALLLQGKCGIGLIDHRDERMIHNLNSVIDYLFKMEQHLPYRPTKNFRTMGRGELVECDGSVRGRPRVQETLEIPI
ncbi:YagK/YfjJ domain-containing protein [Polaromonas aquatica]|uniref:Inovirus-type Gp2 protein n=1 Tax=Polaromonas aquatica TaxID=332657 RepID=A0ABW1TWV3_9BURK